MHLHVYGIYVYATIIINEKETMNLRGDSEWSGGEWSGAGGRRNEVNTLYVYEKVRVILVIFSQRKL